MDDSQSHCQSVTVLKLQSVTVKEEIYTNKRFVIWKKCEIYQLMRMHVSKIVVEDIESFLVY